MAFEKLRIFSSHSSLFALLRYLKHFHFRRHQTITLRQTTSADEHERAMDYR